MSNLKFISLPQPYEQIPEKTKHTNDKNCENSNLQSIYSLCIYRKFYKTQKHNIYVHPMYSIV